MFGGNLANLALEEPAPGREDAIHSVAQPEQKLEDAEGSSKHGAGTDDLPPYTSALLYPGNNGACLEEYIYWARVQREEERQEELKGHGASAATIVDVFLGWYRKAPWVKRRKAILAEKAQLENTGPESYSSSVNEKDSGKDKPITTVTTSTVTPQFEGITDPKTLEGLTTARAMRMASATSVFFLITTDILGPNSAPYGMSQNGWAQGNILFVVFGLAAGFAAYGLQWLFLRLDSSRFPIKTYGDLAHRLVGPWLRHIISFIQFLQLIINCGLLVLSNGQALYQIITQYNHKLCFAVCMIIFVIIGMIFAQIRSLRGLSMFSNLSTIMNWAIVICSMIVVKTSGFSVTTVALQLGVSNEYVEQHPPQTATWPHLDISDQIQGVNLLIFAYGGAMIFPELLSEMKQPKSFWKGCCIAQLVIYVVYVIYACVMYSGAGQYALSIGYQIMAEGGALTFCNIASIITAVVAAAVYANVGLKVSYVNIVEDICHGPAIYSRAGRVVWFIWGVVFWAVAFIIVSAVPQINSLSGLISAIAICNFSYSFPALFVLVWLIHADAMEADGEWTPYDGQKRLDGWWSASRLGRGLFGGMYRVPLPGQSGKQLILPGFLVKGFVLALTLGGFTMSGLGLYAAAETIKTSFAAPGAISTSFSCQAPVS